MINSPLTALVIFVVSTTAVCSADNSCPLFSDFTSGNNTYQHNCSELCLDESQESNTKLQVYGTEYYSKTSDVCQAAVHAGAVGPQGGEVTFTQDNTNHDRRGTIRNRIISKSWFKSWTGRKMNLVCLTDNTTRILVKTDITSWKYRKSDVKVTILRSAQQGASLSARKSQNIRAVRCLGRTAATDVLTVIQAKYQTYVADTSTIRASRGDYLQVPIKKVDKNSLDKVFLRRLPDDWSHNNDSYGNYSLPLIFNRVLPGDAGIYIVGNCQECASNPKQFKEMKDLYTDSAYFHLIVRDCESEYYGANCQSRCPDCENGGICHAVTGSCVCPPGFHGPTCQKACGHDLFGSRCQLHCNKITLGFSPESEEHCLGLRICVPEPYGCSCAPGYMECTEGRYGADCSQGCEYCSDNLCDKTSGKCSSGCLMDIPCADGMPLDLPRLRTPPNVSDIKKNSLVVKFSPWSNEEDDGSDEFNISSYKLQHLREDNNTWVDVKDYFPDIVSGQVTEKIEGLDPGFQYVFRVLVMTPQGAVDGSTNKRVHNVSVTTKCYEPTLYLLNVSEVTNQSAVINWETPGNHARCGMQYDIQLMTGSREEFIHQHTTSNSSYHLRTLKSNTSYVVNITARNNKSEVSLSVQFITLPNAPYRPIVTVMPSGVGNLGVSWKLPPESSSVDSYNVMYKLLQYKACNRTVDPPQDVIQEKTSNNIIELQDLKSYATYEVCVVAENEAPSVDVENFTCTPKNLSGVSCIANLSSGCEAYNGANTTIEVQLLAFLECENENIMFNKSIDIIDKKISVEFSEKLVAAMIYKASLSIINHVGKGMTENTTFKTVEASPPAVRNLSANASSSKVRLLWNDPCPTNGNITQLCYRNVNSTSVDTCTNAVKCEIVTNYERCVDIAELDPQKYYTFMVAAVNSAGKGIFSELQVLTLVTIPGQPEKLNATRLSTSLELVLSQPVNPGGTRLNCTLLLKKRTQIIKQCTATVESETRNPFICKLDELKQGTRFTAESVCCNSAGCSEPLNSVVATLPLSPKLEGKLKVEDMDATSVTLSLPKVVMEGDGVRSLAVLVQQLNKEKLEMAFDSFTTKYLNLKLLGKHVQEESVGRYISSEMRYKRQAGESKYAEMRLNEPVVVGVGGHGLVITLSILGNGTVDSSRIPMDHFNQSIPNTLTTPATPLSVPSNIGKPMLDGQCPENKKKNRYSNNLPYDETRVKLSVIHDDPNTNYINANHVYGFGGLLKYIASQGPKDKNLNTIGDFWRMICEQHITVIIMVANFVEGGKKKVGEYISFGSNLVVEDYTVEVVNTDHHSHYNVSLVQVWKHGIAHTVIHYHYTNWPDHGVPSGMVVHCSAGIGRTGTVLQVLLLHEMLMVQGSMDPLEVLQRLRECRARLVENVAQYNLSLQIFDEVMYGSNTSIVSINFPQQLEDCLKKNHNLYQRAKALPSGLTFGATSQAEYHYLNRNPTILPSVSQRIFLSMENGETLSQYINAIRVNGLDHPNEMVVTEHPLPTTLTKFWRLVVEKKCMSVVLINTFNDCEEDIFPSLLPRHDTDLVLGNYTIRTLHVANHSSFIQYSIEVFSKQDIQEAVTVYQITSWPYGSEVPSSPDALIGVSEILLQAHHHDTGPILLSCGDGVTGCGLMAAAKLTIEKLQKYKTVDVYRTVVYLLRARQEFFVSQAQFDFLYIVADKYLQDFDTYVNFQI
ncbi:Receptor-type tyrosine-protein phosphatase C-like [Homarus americanus]|uniref:Receptor-type tyrosine-protein phosphatase C-like n=1 Tax=Homarus americanus TaxID=6706 RepID=A0A8J5TK02_HOMAM|nr:Receptor-type tyrosine-protein phosphatase C-like [Homarus americanus]